MIHGRNFLVVMLCFITFETRWRSGFFVFIARFVCFSLFVVFIMREALSLKYKNSALFLCLLDSRYMAEISILSCLFSAVFYFCLILSVALEALLYLYALWYSLFCMLCLFFSLWFHGCAMMGTSSFLSADSDETRQKWSSMITNFWFTAFAFLFCLFSLSLSLSLLWSLLSHVFLLCCFFRSIVFVWFFFSSDFFVPMLSGLPCFEGSVCFFFIMVP